MKSLKKVGFFSAFILPGLLVTGFYMGGPWLWAIHIFVFILVPVLDEVAGKDRHNVSKEAFGQEMKRRYYRMVTYMWVYVQLMVMGWCFYIVATHSLSLVEWTALTSGAALVTGGIGITVAHELGHKASRLQQFYAKVLLMMVGYMHFLIEHNRGHHVRVATPEDPASSRKGESFYAFWPRSVFGGYQSAWKLESERLKKKRVGFFTLENQMLIYTLSPVIFVAFILVIGYLIMGEWHWEILIFYMIQAFLAFTLLELVNYIEHYGMQRARLPNGRYEPVTPLHSWNASQSASNFLLFQLQRHSDHHAYAYKPYQVLDHHEESPQLPAGYSAMLMVALIPPWWFKLMDSRLEKWQDEKFKV